ncbi:unnamed protein product [Lymnaea stagnalis]|uniref:Uncharacterized protein n=1 Tax=Lymnaea stagnalis TaxID=6523 RepID=A0AAV2H8J1_LYMST
MMKKGDSLAQRSWFCKRKHISRSLFISFLSILISFSTLSFVAVTIYSRNFTELNQNKYINKKVITDLALFEEILRSKKKPHSIKVTNRNETQTLKFSPVTVHIQLNPPAHIIGLDSKEPVFSYSDHFEATFDLEINDKQTLRGVGSFGHSVEIYYSGWYYIYSSITFRRPMTWHYQNCQKRAGFIMYIESVQTVQPTLVYYFVRHTPDAQAVKRARKGSTPVVYSI